MSRAYKDYSSLYKKIKSLSNKWWHYPDSIWIVLTNEKSPSQIIDKLKSSIDDDILIIEVNHNCDGWLHQEAWDWIEENIPISKGNRLQKKH